MHYGVLIFPTEYAIRIDEPPRSSAARASASLRVADPVRQI